MNIRTPRRRISPRTRRRYRAIREFFRKAIGSSQPDTSININSSIALNVTDLKRKIIGIEQQLEQVSKHCHDVVCLRDISSKATESVHQEVNDPRCTNVQSVASSQRKLKGVETRLLYKTSDCTYRKSDESDCEQKQQNDRHNAAGENMSNEFERPRKKNDKESLHREINGTGSKLHKHKTQSAYENFSTAYSTSSFHSLACPRNAYSHAEHVGKRNDRRYYKKQYRSISPGQLKDKKQKEHSRKNKQDRYETIYENKPEDSHKHKHQSLEVDQDFIADIIRRQYKPTKLFEKRESNISQFSAPVCRDQEFSCRENVQESSGLCSCCHVTPRRTRHRDSDLSDVRSVCDAHLYSSKRHSRSRHRRRHADYNDSDLYDLVPVKEKASPKSRRKFVEESLRSYEAYREVPPSPRTLRPRLNLQSQHCYEINDYTESARGPRQKYSSRRSKRNQLCEASSVESDIASVAAPEKTLRCAKYPQKTYRPAKVQVGHEENTKQITSTVSILQSPVYPNDMPYQSHAVVDTTLDKTQETDKTDKALSEIKDILQSFLLEIKQGASQFDKSDTILKTGEQHTGGLQSAAHVNGGTAPNSGQSFNSVGHCAVPPCIAPTAFGSPCCYPVVYPVNCMQNGYIMTSPSFTCTNCANISNEHLKSGESPSNRSRNRSEKFNPETEELIKEIYKFVAQGPTAKRDSKYGKTDYETKILTSRSVGESHTASKHNAKVGTPSLKYSSKSCEAISSKVPTDNYYTTASHSDTMVERLSLELTASETDINESAEENKRGYNKFSKVLHSIGLFKKKKKDIIVEQSENESLIDVEVKPKQTRPPPFRQDATNYMMYQQDYFQPPPRPHPHYQHQSEYHPDYHPPYNPRVPEYPQSPINDRYSYEQPGYSRASPYRSPRPSVPPFSKSYYDSTYHPDTHGPLCLKEIEVKSTATQSERKLTTFQRFKKRLQPPARMPRYEDPQKTCATQTAKDEPKPAPKDNLPKWLKKLQEKAMQDNKDKMGMDPAKYSVKTQQELEQGTNNIRNAMIKKMFYKRNPFSPRNLLMNTLIGRDKTSYGVPPPLFKPKLWF